MKLILHNYRRCPFCIRTRILLSLKDINYEIVEEPLRVWTEWMLKNVEDKRVPVLRILKDDGTEEIMCESNDINLYLDKNFEGDTFTPGADSKEYAEMIKWWKWCTDNLKPQIDIYKYGRNLKFDKEKNIQDTKQLHILLEKLEETLSNSKNLIRSNLTLADIAIIPFIRQIMRTRGGEFEFTNLPHVLRWTNEVVESSWFLNDVMKKIEVNKNTQ